MIDLPLPRIAFSLAAILLSACVQSHSAAPSANRVDVVVTFGSYAMGIDRRAAAHVEHLAATDPDVSGIRRRQAGPEGEYVLAIETVSSADAERLARTIRQTLPDKPLGPVSVHICEGHPDADASRGMLCTAPGARTRVHKRP